MDNINPYIKVNAGGIPRLAAQNIPGEASDGSHTYDFKEHKFLKYPYSGLIIFKIPTVVEASTAGNIYFTTGGENPKQVFDMFGDPLKSDNVSFAKGGIFIGWYSDEQLQILTGLSPVS